MLGLLDLGYRSYATSVLQGALHDASRMATVGNFTLAQIDARVKARLSNFATRSTVTTSTTSYYEFSGVSQPEKIVGDTVPLNVYNAGDCFEDANGNNAYDTDRGAEQHGRLRTTSSATRSRSPIPRIVPARRLHGLGQHPDDHPEYGAAQPALRGTDRCTTNRNQRRRERDGDSMLKTTARRARVGGASLRGCTSGVAMMEFAFALPVVLALGLMGLETANYAMAHLRVSNIAMLTADNAARVRDSDRRSRHRRAVHRRQDERRQHQFRAERPDHPDRPRADAAPEPTSGSAGSAATARSIIRNPTANMRPRTAAGAAITNGTEIYNADRITPNTTNPSSPPQRPLITGMGSAQRRSRPQSGTAVMVVEVVYTYQPIIPNSFLAGRQIRYESAFNVRQRNDQTLKQCRTDHAEELQHLRRLRFRTRSPLG